VAQALWGPGRNRRAVDVSVRAIASRAMAPKRKKKKPAQRPAKKRAKASAKDKARAVSAVKKKKKKAGKRKGSGGGAKIARAKSAYEFFCAEKRPELLRRHGLGSNAEKFGEAMALLAKAWQDTAPADRAKYEGCAALSRHKSLIERTAKEARSDTSAPKLASVVKSTVIALGRADHLAHSNGLVREVVSALEGLDQKMKWQVRAAVGRQLGPGAASAAATDMAHKVLGPVLGERLMGLLRRWHGLGSNGNKAAPAKEHQAAGPVPEAEAASPGAQAGADTPLDQDVRNKVVGMLMRAFARGSGKSEVVRCRGIEDELFAAAPSPKEYKRRARSLLFNLGAADGALMRRVASGELSPKALVGLGAEDLASDALKAERVEERERYFRCEVHDLQGPPKTRRGLFSVGHVPGRRAERAAEGPELEEEALDGEGNIFTEAPESLDGVAGAAEEGAEGQSGESGSSASESGESEVEPSEAESSSSSSSSSAEQAFAASKG